jgi:hypothetical protein
MKQDSFKIEVTDDVVDVAWDDDSSTTQSIIAAVLGTGLAVVLSYYFLFRGGENPGLVAFVLANPTLYHDDVAAFYVKVIGIALYSTIFAFIFIYGLRLLFPFGDRIHCDRSTFTISQIAFWSFGKRWKVQSVPPSKVTLARYGVVRRVKGRENDGIIVDVCGKSWKVFEDIDVSHANHVLRGLSKMGVNVRLSDEKAD